MNDDNSMGPSPADTQQVPQRKDPPVPARFPDIDKLSYESARDELADVVSSLERGQADLEQSVNLWERGEALALHCTTLLDRATSRLDAASRETEDQ